MREVWRPIYGWTRLYEISNLGRVQRVAPGKATHIGKVLAPATSRRGYLKVALCRDGKSKTYRLPRLVARAFHGPARGREVNHINGVKSNNRADNLEWVTRAGQMRHAAATGLLACGEAQGLSRLTEADVRSIRKQCTSGVRTSALAVEFSVHRRTIQSVVARLTWAHVT